MTDLYLQSTISTILGSSESTTTKNLTPNIQQGENTNADAGKSLFNQPKENLERIIKKESEKLPPQDGRKS